MLTKLITQLEAEMDEYWDDLANGLIPNDSVYYTAQEIEALGVGAVLIPTMQGQMRWFDLVGMEF